MWVASLRSVLTKDLDSESLRELKENDGMDKGEEGITHARIQFENAVQVLRGPSFGGDQCRRLL